MKSNIKTEKIEIEKLKPYENNAKVHTEEQILALMQSIQELGYNDPIQVNEENMILAGHGRYEALKRLGVTGKILVTRIVGLTDIEQKAYMLAHNKLTMKTGFDFDKLKLELKEITLEMPEFKELSGFKEAEIENILKIDEEEEVEFNDLEEEEKLKEKEYFLSFDKIKHKISLEELEKLKEVYGEWAMTSTTPFVLWLTGEKKCN